MQALNTALASGKDVKLSGDIEGTVIVPQAQNGKITIDGNGHTLAGYIVVDGKSQTITTAGLTIKNLKFKAESISADACIRLGDGTNATRYTCNVTVDGCTFDVPGAVGVKSYTGGDKNLTIKGCTATARTHSLVQAKGIDGVIVEDCHVYSKNGMNFNNSNNVSVIGCEADVKGYAIRFGESTNSVVENYSITNCTLKSACEEANDAVIVFRAGALDAVLNLTNTTLIGSREYLGAENVTINK